jgi:raffinose/stachyose/melibiose transport system substrate-binding protein
MTKGRVLRGLTVLLALTAFLAACGDDDDDGGASAGSGEKIDVAKAGDVTLKVLDQQVRSGQDAALKRLNAEFMERYPNVTIERTNRSFEDLQKTVRLAVTRPNAPDIVQANQGYGIMGALAKAGILLPLDGYADAYGWRDRYSEGLLAFNSFSADGAKFGTGNLYGISQAGEIVGVFYNKDKVPEPPKTLAEFESLLEKAKAEGDIGIQLGNAGDDKYGGIHDYETVLGRTASKEQVRDFVFGRPGGEFNSPEFEAAAAKFQEWNDAGYLTPKVNGTGYDATVENFAKGEGYFFIGGTWNIATLKDAMGDRVGFFILPGESENDEPIALGGEDLPWTITRKSENPDVAAAYIDFITNENATKVLVETGNLPAPPVPAADRPKSGVEADVFEQWDALNESDGLIPYLDYAYDTAYDDIGGGIQELLDGRQDPKEFVDSIQSKYSEFIEGL